MLFHPNEWPSLPKGCSICQGSHGFCYAPSKTAWEAEPWCLTCTHGAMLSADIYPQQLWVGAMPPGTSAWTAQPLWLTMPAHTALPALLKGKKEP